MEAATNALQTSDRPGACDLVLLFATASHDAQQLRDAVLSVVGTSVPVIGGGAIGAMTHDCFGYAGDQVVLALLWLEGVEYQCHVEGDLTQGEIEVGRRLGRRFAQSGMTPDASALLFYDAMNRTGDGVRMNMATPLLLGIQEGLGFLPALVGAGFMGDYAGSATQQWTGAEIVSHHALALRFSAEVRIDTTIMHGCRPATGYYTVTRAEGPVILEIDGQPALTFMENLLGAGVPPEEYPFFLTFGMNRGQKWEAFNDDNYANHLCLTIDKAHNGLVMFEPDMVAGTEFQLMYHSLDLDYIRPKVERLFSEIRGRKPVLALYINCAGRAAAYAGNDLEDALEVRNVVAGRVPLLGMYSGVEIAPVMGYSRPLDWTGVFCILSVPQ
jgi:hypothetical protein